MSTYWRTRLMAHDARLHDMAEQARLRHESRARPVRTIMRDGLTVRQELVPFATGDCWTDTDLARPA
jgi:hypothetical protein